MSRKEWTASLKPYAQASYYKAIKQIINTLIPYIIMLALTVGLFQQNGFSIAVVGLSIVTGFFMVRVFILFHDCTHLSFVPSKKWNNRLGFIFGIFAFTDYGAWQLDHNTHHGAVGNLDRRGVGDIWTLTIDEYNEKSLFMKGLYRLFRHPLFLFGVAPFFLFAVIQRFVKKGSTSKVIKSTILTNLGMLLVGAIYSLFFSLSAYLIIQLFVVFIAGSTGVWLFYVQHQFEEVYWASGDDWDSVDAALKGSTYYKLPIIFEWFSGYIGYHHIHHLNSRIPNYNLKPCYMELHELKKARTVTLFKSFHLAFLQLYDDKKQRLISFKQFRLEY